MRKSAMVLLALVCRCGAVIYHLNDSLYDLMPPLSGLDEYDRCLRGGSAYCVARLDLLPGSDRHVFDLIQDYSAYSKKHFNHTFIDRGVCIMETCKKHANSSNDMGSVVESCVNETVWERYGLQAKMSRLYYCDEPAASRMTVDWWDWTVVGAFVLLLVLNIAGTAYHIFSVKRDEDVLKSRDVYWLLSFSVVRNWLDLVAQPKKDDRHAERLKPLYGLKACTMVITIMLHVMILYSGPFTENPHYYEKAFDSPVYFIALNAITIVQIFFGVSGFLLVYKLQIESENRPVSWSILPKQVLLRWCRLTPPYALMIAYITTWLRHLSSGPLWNFFTAKTRDDCRRHWWKNILYIQNFDSELSFCVPAAWYIAVDLQLYVVCLAMYVATTVRGRYLAAGVMLVVGMVAPALNVWLQDLSPIVVVSPEMLRSFYDRTFMKLHIRVENNLCCFIIGMLVAYRVYGWQKQGVDISKYKSFRNLATAWLVIPAFSWVFYTGRIFYEPEPVAFAVTILYAMLLRVVLGAIIAYLIVVLLCRTNDSLRALLAWSGFVPLGRLSYMVYLLNMNLINFQGAQRTQLLHISLFDFIVISSGMTILSFLAAVPCCLLVEMPTYKLFKYLLRSENRVEHLKKTK